MLLTKLDGNTIPRGTGRAVLHDKGRIVNMVDFQSSWNEQEVRARIEKAFIGLLNLEKPYPRCVVFSLYFKFALCLILAS